MNPRSRVEQMIHISEPTTGSTGRSTGAYVLATVLLLLAVLPALRGS
jgi:hypothetical protein